MILGKAIFCLLKGDLLINPKPIESLNPQAPIRNLASHPGAPTALRKGVTAGRPVALVLPAYGLEFRV